MKYNITIDAEQFVESNLKKFGYLLKQCGIDNLNLDFDQNWNSITGRVTFNHLETEIQEGDFLIVIDGEPLIISEEAFKELSGEFSTSKIDTDI